MDRLRHKRVNRFWIWTAVIASTVFCLPAMLTSCAPAPVEHVKVPPAPTPAESGNPTPTFTRDPLPADLVADQKMSTEAFRALPKVEQLKYWSWLTQYKDAYAARFIAVSGNPDDTLVPATKENTGAQILTQFHYTLRIVESFSKDGALDDDSIEKALAAIYDIEKNEKNLDFDVQQILANPKPINVDLEALNGDHRYPLRTIIREGQTPVASRQPNGPKRLIATVDFVGANQGDTVHQSFEYTEFTDYLGRPDAAWVYLEGVTIQ